MWQEAGVGRHQERGAIAQTLLVPPHVARDLGVVHQAQQRTQQRALARSDGAGDDGEAAAHEFERHVVHTSTARVHGRQSVDAEPLQRDAIGPIRGGAGVVFTASDGQVAFADQIRLVVIGHQTAHAAECDGRLLASGQHSTDHARQEAQPADVRSEHGQLTHVERAGRERTGRHQQHQAQTHVGSALTERLHAVVEHTIAHGGVPTSLDQSVQMGEGGFGGVVHLHRGGGSHDVADETADRAGGLAVGCSIALDARVEHAGGDGDGRERQQQDGCGAGVDAAEHEPGEDGEDDPGADVDHAVDELSDVVDVVAEVGDGLTRRSDRLPGLGPTARQLCREQVGAQERLHVHEHTRPHQGTPVDGGHADGVDHQRRSCEPVHLRGVALLQRVKATAEQPSVQHRPAEEEDEQTPAQPEAAGPVLRHAPRQAPHGGGAAHDSSSRSSSCSASPDSSASSSR